MAIEFTGCTWLDFELNYSAQRQLIMEGNAVKLCWRRATVTPDMPGLVQFCKKRGRLNRPLACLSERKAECHLYAEAEHIVEVSEGELNS
jgi:hypothetical protein